MLGLKNFLAASALLAAGALAFAGAAVAQAPIKLGAVLATQGGPSFLGDPERALYTPIVLDGVNDLGESILITGASGFYGYAFGGLRPGVYTVTEIQPVGFS